MWNLLWSSRVTKNSHKVSASVHGDSQSIKLSYKEHFCKFFSDNRPAVELRPIFGEVSIVVGVQQISFFALWTALQGLEQNFNLHFALQLVCCRPDRRQTKLWGHKEAQCATYQAPHHAAVQSWQLLDAQEDVESCCCRLCGSFLPWAVTDRGFYFLVRKRPTSFTVTGPNHGSSPHSTIAQWTGEDCWRWKAAWEEIPPDRLNWGL